MCGGVGFEIVTVLINHTNMIDAYIKVSGGEFMVALKRGYSETLFRGEEERLSGIFWWVGSHINI